MILAHPWLLALLPLPLVFIRLLAAHRETQSSVRVPALARLAQLVGDAPSQGAVVLGRSRWQKWLLIVVWVSALLAAARPQWVGEPIEKTLPSRDLLLAVDLSGSMETEDFTDEAGNQVDRLTAVKQVLDGFLSRREGDRVGLIFFGSAAFVQAPFTEDLELCRTLLNEAQVRMAGPQTVIGDAVGLALTVFERSEQEDRVLILLTDGNDTNSQVPPERAAQIAKDQGVTIHTVAVGDPQAVGEEKMDEEVLQEMASETGGGFFRANDRDELEQIYDRLDAMETHDIQTQSYRPKTDLFHLPLALFLLAGLGYHGAKVVRVWGRAGPARAAATSMSLMALSFVAATSGDKVLGSFHFIRPGWLLAFVPVALIIAAILQRKDARSAWRGVIEDGLLDHLLVKPKTEGVFQPVHLLAVAWCVAVIALAGPTWRREPSPFADDEAAVVFVVEVSATMACRDIQPSRQQRSVHKIGDLLAARVGMESALVAYAGSAHLVMPITGDAEIIKTFASELDPKIMPIEGDVLAQALTLANQQLVSAERPGSIVLLTDGIDPGQNEALKKYSGAPVHVLAVAGDQGKPLPLDSPPAPALDIDALQKSVDAMNATVTVVSPDDTDVKRLSRNITTSFAAAQQDDGGDRWQDMGYWLTPFICLISLFWFRPGWVVKWD